MKSQAAVKKPGKQRFKFVSDIISELKKVTWPSRREATYLTTLVIIFTVVVAIILGVIDYGFSKLMNVILLR
ncbi:MAG: preprotein translocase subunit SecE [Chloroflexi bacterium]|nr:preprotein translocase subunit SecE [Chloroflexota bacterium]